MEKTPADWANEQSKFIKLEDGGKIIGRYTGFREGEFRGTPLLEYDIDGKVFSSGSKILARAMGTVKPQSIIQIQRFGTGTDTRYEVEVLKAPLNVPEGSSDKPLDQQIADAAAEAGVEVKWED